MNIYFLKYFFITLFDTCLSELKRKGGNLDRLLRLEKSRSVLVHKKKLVKTATFYYRFTSLRFIMLCLHKIIFIDIRELSAI